jgi:hypothetical protein
MGSGITDPVENKTIHIYKNNNIGYLQFDLTVLVSTYIQFFIGHGIVTKVGKLESFHLRPNLRSRKRGNPEFGLFTLFLFSPQIG